MKTTLKLRRAIYDAIIAATCEAIDTHCPEIKDNPPDTWDAETVRRFDLITDVEGLIDGAIRKVLEAPTPPSYKSKPRSKRSVDMSKETEGWIKVIQNSRKGESQS